jgi:hypothetical protein
VDPRCRPGDHAGEEEGGELVGHHDRGPRRQGFEQSRPPARLHVGVVEDSRRLESRPVVVHPLKDEAVQAIAGPAVVRAQSFQDQEGLFQAAGPIEGPLQTEVEARAPISNHPVKHVVAGRLHRGFVLRLDSNLWNAHHPSPASISERAVRFDLAAFLAAN